MEHGFGGYGVAPPASGEGFGSAPPTAGTILDDVPKLEYSDSDGVLTTDNDADELTAITNNDELVERIRAKSVRSAVRTKFRRHLTAR